MSEESTPNIASVQGVSEFLQKNGLATMLVLAGLWFVVLPLNDNYQKMLEEVSTSNSSLAETVKELKTGIIEIGRINQANIVASQELLKDIDRRLEDVEETSKQMLQTLLSLQGNRGQSIGTPNLQRYGTQDKIQSPASD